MKTLLFVLKHWRIIADVAQRMYDHRHSFAKVKVSPKTAAGLANFIIEIVVAKADGRLSNEEKGRILGRMWAVVGYVEMRN